MKEIRQPAKSPSQVLNRKPDANSSLAPPPCVAAGYAAQGPLQPVQARFGHDFANLTLSAGTTLQVNENRHNEGSDNARSQSRIADSSAPTQLQIRDESGFFNAAPPSLSIAPNLVIQCDVGDYALWMNTSKKMIGEMEVNHYLLHEFAANQNVQVVNAQGVPKNLKRLDANAVHVELRKRIGELLSNVHIRPDTPTHSNIERNLPVAQGESPYYEMGMAGGDGARIVVDNRNGDIYFSYHYGQGQLQHNPDSPFIQMGNLTNAERAVPHYEVIFFQCMTNAYASALRHWETVKKGVGANTATTAEEEQKLVAMTTAEVEKQTQELAKRSNVDATTTAANTLLSTLSSTHNPTSNSRALKSVLEIYFKYFNDILTIPNETTDLALVYYQKDSKPILNTAQTELP